MASSKIVVRKPSLDLPALRKRAEDAGNGREGPKASFEDHARVIDFERDMRRHRADSEAFFIELREPGSFAVTGSSGGTYVVDWVDSPNPESRSVCSCPDFIHGRLGVCKHVLAVRRALSLPKRKRKGIDRATDAERPVVLPRHYDDGRLGLELMTSGGENRQLRSIAEAGEEARVTHSAVEAARIIERREASEARRCVIAEALERGRLEVDVLSAPLFPYQREGVSHLLRAGRAVLADDMGLGKTVQTIAACEVLRREDERRRVLIVCPASLKAQWASEISRYARAEAVVIGGDAEARRASLASNAPYVIVNYELTWRELGSLRSRGTDVLVLDEAQRARNFRTKTASSLRNIPSEFLFVLTGTPIENRLDDLYGILQLVDPNILGPLWKFNLDYHVRHAETGKVVGYRNLSELRRVIAPWVLRRRKEDVLEQLPPLTEQTRYVALTKEQTEQEEMHRVSASKLAAIARQRTLGANDRKILVGHLQSARLACNFVRGSPSPKIDELAQLVTEIAGQESGSKVLVFSEWIEMLKLAAEKLDALKIGHLMLHGSIPTPKRAALIEQFRSDVDKVVLLSTDAGGVGLNLQVASYVIHLDLPWNPSRLDQRTARSHRVGQSRGVSVTYLVAESGIERGIEGTLTSKRAMRAAAIEPASELDSLDMRSFTEFLGAEEQDEEREQKPVVDRRELDAFIEQRVRLALVVLNAGYGADAVRAMQEVLHACRDLSPDTIEPELTAHVDALAARAEAGESIDQETAIKAVDATRAVLSRARAPRRP